MGAAATGRAAASTPYTCAGHWKRSAIASRGEGGEYGEHPLGAVIAGPADSGLVGFPHRPEHVELVTAVGAAVFVEGHDGRILVSGSRFCQDYVATNTAENGCLQMQKSTKTPWMPADDYGRSLPPLSLNLLVRRPARSVEFYENVLQAEVVYWDEDFAALKIGGVDFMLHADHTYEEHPWVDPLASGVMRGVGAELRALGLDPDEAEARARGARATVVEEAKDKPHGWRETMIADPDGYVWAVGVQIP